MDKNFYNVKKFSFDYNWGNPNKDHVQCPKRFLFGLESSFHSLWLMAAESAQNDHQSKNIAQQQQQKKWKQEKEKHFKRYLRNHLILHIRIVS